MRETPERAARRAARRSSARAATARLVGAVSYKRDGDTVDIHRLVVDPAAFRGGIATALLDALEAREAGATHWTVGTGAANAPGPRALRAPRLHADRGAGRPRRRPLGPPGPLGRPLDSPAVVTATRDPPARARAPARARRAPPEPRRPRRGPSRCSCSPASRSPRSRCSGRRTPTYDPWAWIIWGREVMHLDLVTTDGPSWKPLPILFTAPFSLLGDDGGARAVDPRRARRRPARDRDGLPARGAARGAGGGRDRRASRCCWLGRVRPQLRARQLGGAARRALPAGRSSATSTAAAATRSCSASLAGLLRPEVWPFCGRSTGSGCVAGEWRDRPPWRTFALVGGTGRADARAVVRCRSTSARAPLLRAAERARQPNPDSAAFAASPFLEVFRRSASILTVPVYVGAVDRRRARRAAAPRAVRAWWCSRSRRSRRR